VILRLAALGAVVLGLVVFLFFLQLVGKAPWSPPEMRHLRAMKDRASAPDRLAPFTLADFESLPQRRPLAEYARLEQRGVSFDGYVQNLLTATDGDSHFELVGTRRLPGGPDTAYVTAEVTPQWSCGSVPWSFENLVAILRPNRGGATPWDQGPRHVRVSGWLLYDFQDDPLPVPGALERRLRLTGWEIHPVTRIEVRDEADSAWREVAP
jgi:hypothetical protein